MNLVKQHQIYFNDFKHMNASLLFGLIIITFGLYIIPWIYTKNKEFELIDKNAPDANRGVIVLFMIPFVWGYSSYVIKKLILNHPAFSAFSYVIWSFIIFLALKYAYDFCSSFGRITNTSGFAWFLVFLIPFMGVPAMQAELNIHFNRMQVRKKYDNLYK